MKFHDTKRVRSHAALPPMRSITESASSSERDGAGAATVAEDSALVAE